MELLSGESLRHALGRQGSMSIERAVDIVCQACAGMTVVHAAGLIHRDIKPENLWVSQADGRDWCKILDFGVCRSLLSHATAHGTRVGTLRYMAPEQFADSSSVGPQADVYALAAVLYESITGVPVHPGRTPEELRCSILATDPRPMRSLRNDVPRPLEAAIHRALRRSTGERFATVDEFGAALGPYAPYGWHIGLGAAPSPSVPSRRSVRLSRTSAARRRAKVTPGMLALAGAAVVGVIAGWWATSHAASQSTHPPSVIDAVPSPATNAGHAAPHGR
jgi:eukaryotic-like serine/threonine-protein kinase